MSPAEPTAPGASQILPLLVVAPAVGLALRWASERPMASVPVAASFTGVMAGLIGVPVLFWLLDHGRHRPSTLMVAGLLTGAIPPAIVLFCGMIGLIIRHDVDFMWSVFADGAPLPWFGQITWPRFRAFVGWCSLVGTTSALVHWGLAVSPRRGAGIGIAAGALMIVMIAVWLWP